MNRHDRRRAKIEARRTDRAAPPIDVLGQAPGGQTLPVNDWISELQRQALDMLMRAGISAAHISVTISTPDTNGMSFQLARGVNPDLIRLTVEHAAATTAEYVTAGDPNTRRQKAGLN